MSTPFGWELLLDCYDCSPGLCDDLAHCYRFLEQIVHVLKVKAQSPPFLFRTDAKHFKDKAGLSGWVPLVESGVQLHTLSQKDFISIDIYSCKPFAPHAVQAFCQATFLPKAMDTQHVLRGCRYHQRRVRRAG